MLNLSLITFMIISLRRLGKSMAVAVFLSALLVGAFATIAYASHSWGSYHWARSANPFTVKLGDNVSTTWDSYLTEASSDWSQSSVLDTTVVAGGTDPKRCRATSGRVEVCSAKYGFNGWLGLAQIWVSGDHITKALNKLNDTYFNTSTYNTPPWRRFVMCQEVGHTFGLDHQDENFSNPNLGTCMDYTSDPDGPPSNEHPNQHDYDQLALIYEHFDAVTTIFSKNSPGSEAMGNDVDTSNPAEWGKVIRKSGDGRSSLHERDLGKGNKLFTFVIWAN